MVARSRGCNVPVDGTDFVINEPRPFNSKFYSQEFKHSGFRYEIAISLDTGDIVDVHGPFPCGTNTDLKIN